MKKCFLAAIIALFCLTQAQAVTYTKKYDGKKMTLRAPVIEPITGGRIARSSGPKRKDVRFLFEKQVFKANKVKLYRNKIFLQNGFEGQSNGASLSGKELIYNLQNNYFDAEYVEVTSGFLQVATNRLSFYGRSIVFSKARIGLTFLALNINIDSVTTYPGWMVIKDLSLGYDTTNLYTIPVWVYDLRRNAFKIPYPLPEAGSSFFRGNYLFLNTHYYLNERLYGFARIGSSQLKGGMFGLGQILRFDDRHQMYLGGDFWAWKEPQLKWEYNYSFMELPYKKRRLTFGELVDYNLKVADLDSSDIRATYTKREVINNEYIDRDLEFGYSGHFTLIKDPRTLDLDLHLNSGHIYEYSTDILAMRTNSDFHFTYEYPLGFLDPLWWGIGYNRSDYDIRPWNWQRVDGSVKWERWFWMFRTGIKYTHYFYDSGGSPFIFDQKYIVPNNNVIYDLRFGTKDHNIGVRYWTDIELHYLVDTTTYLTWTISGWVWNIAYSTLRESYSIGVGVNLF